LRRASSSDTHSVADGRRGIAPQDPRSGFRRNGRRRWRGGQPLRARRPRLRNVPASEGRRPGGIPLHVRDRADRVHAFESALRRPSSAKALITPVRSSSISP
jgi:hypothetical protein